MNADNYLESNLKKLTIPYIMVEDGVYYIEYCGIEFRVLAGNEARKFLKDFFGITTPLDEALS